MIPKASKQFGILWNITACETKVLDKLNERWTQFTNISLLY